MWGAHRGVLWPQPSPTSQGGQAHRAPRQTLGSFAGDPISQWQCGIRLTAEVSSRVETTMPRHRLAAFQFPIWPPH